MITKKVYKDQEIQLWASGGRVVVLYIKIEDEFWDTSKVEGENVNERYKLS